MGMISWVKVKFAVLAITSVLVMSCASSSNEIAASYVSPTQFQSFSCDQLSQELARLGRRKSELAGDIDKKASSDDGVAAVSLIIFWPAAFALGGNQSVETEYARLKGEYDAVQQNAIQKNCTLIIETASEENLLAAQALSSSPVVVDSVSGKYVDNYNQSIKIKQSGNAISGVTTYRYNDAEISGDRENGKLLLKLNVAGLKGDGELMIIGDGARLKGTIDMPGYSGRGGVWILSKLGPDGEVLEPTVQPTPVVNNKKSNSKPSPSEDDYLEYYGEAESEVNSGTYDKNLWAKALVKAEGNEEKRKAIYIEIRAKQLYELNN